MVMWKVLTVAHPHNASSSMAWRARNTLLITTYYCGTTWGDTAIGTNMYPRLEVTISILKAGFLGTSDGTPANTARTS